MPTPTSTIAASSRPLLRFAGGSMTNTVDLTVISDAMLDGAFNRLLAEFAAAKDACDYEAMAECHISIEHVIAEYDRRTDAWIADHSQPTEVST